ncbi:hypothetical protein ACC745_39560, partial [Rhizobium ruizarguesonis]
TGREKVFQMVMYYTELSHVVTAFTADEKLMADLILIGQEDGSIPKTADPDAAALAFLCFTKGLRVASGAMLAAKGT